MLKIGKHCEENPGTKVGIFRQNLSDLKKSTLTEFKDLFGDKGSYNGQSHEFTFNNGSTVLFHQLSELRKLRNHNLSAAVIEQAEETTEDAFWYLLGRLRRTDADHNWIGLLSNPEGHDWIWKLFCKKDIPRPDMNSREELDDADIDPPSGEDFHYICASSWTNKENLDEQYLSGLSAMPEDMQKKYVEGSRDVISGSVYPMLDPSVHLIEPFKIEKEWPKWCTLDYGDVNATANLWVTMDYENRIYIYREHHKARNDDGKEWLISQHSEAIREIEWETTNFITPYRENPKNRLIDPQCSAKTKTKRGPNGQKRKKYSVIEEFSDHGLNFTPWRRANSRKEKLAQINRVGEMFKKQDDFEHPITGESPAPRAYIFETCEKTWEEHTQYQWEDSSSRQKGGNLPDAPKKEDDHSCDAFRGWCGEKLMGPEQNMVTKPGTFKYYQNKVKRKNRRKKQKTFNIGAS